MARWPVTLAPSTQIFGPVVAVKYVPIESWEPVFPNHIDQRTSGSAQHRAFFSAERDIVGVITTWGPVVQVYGGGVEPMIPSGMTTGTKEI